MQFTKRLDYLCSLPADRPWGTQDTTHFLIANKRFYCLSYNTSLDYVAFHLLSEDTTRWTSIVFIGTNFESHRDVFGYLPIKDKVRAAQRYGLDGFFDLVCFTRDYPLTVAKYLQLFE